MLVVGGEKDGVLMAVPDACCERDRREFSLQSQSLVVGAGEGVFSAVSDAGCGRGESVVLMTVSYAGVWEGRGGGSNGTPRQRLWKRGETGVLMAIRDAGCGEAEVLITVSDAGCVPER